jgi:hypothetical protein
MKKSYKEFYQAPEFTPFVLPESLHLLVNFSLGGEFEDPEYDTDWGEPKDLDFTKQNPLG